MHEFHDLIAYCTNITLESLRDEEERAIVTLHENGSTPAVIALRMIRMQRCIFAVGMFSIFEAKLQADLSCENGFIEALKILESKGKESLKNDLQELILAINVLKHGKGRSYEALSKKSKQLPFKVLLKDESFFFEGDVSEIPSFIMVDENFVRRCAKTIEEVSEAVRLK